MTNTGTLNTAKYTTMLQNKIRIIIEGMTNTETLNTAKYTTMLQNKYE